MKAKDDYDMWLAKDPKTGDDLIWLKWDDKDYPWAAFAGNFCDIFPTRKAAEKYAVKFANGGPYDVVPARKRLPGEPLE